MPRAQKKPAPAAPVKAPQQVLQDIAAQAIARGVTSRDSLRDAVMRAIRKDRAMLQLAVEQLAAGVIARAALLRENRRLLLVTPEPDQTAGLHAIAEARAATLFDYVLPDGSRLGDATAGILDEAIELHQQLEQANGKKARWLSQVRTLLPDDRAMVEHTIDEAAIRAAYAKA